MADSFSCPECGKQVEPSDDLTEQKIDEVDVEDEGKITLYGNRDLFLCKECKTPMGVGR